MYLKIYIVQYDFATLLGLRIKIIYKEFVKRATHRRNSVLVNPVNFVPPEAAGPIDHLCELFPLASVPLMHTFNFSVSVDAAMAVPLQVVDPYTFLV